MNTLIELFQDGFASHAPLLIAAGAAVAYLHHERRDRSVHRFRNYVKRHTEKRVMRGEEIDERERLAEAIALFGHAPCR